jgi:hypothetical protein
MDTSLVQSLPIENPVFDNMVSQTAAEGAKKSLSNVELEAINIRSRNSASPQQWLCSDRAAAVALPTNPLHANSLCNNPSKQI